MYRIFIVEDDRSLARELKSQIEQYGNEARIVSDLHKVTDEIRAYDPQLVLMDIMLPFRDGYFRTAEIRKCSTVSAMVLNAKIQAVLRRTYELKGGGAAQRSSVGGKLLGHGQRFPS